MRGHIVFSSPNLPWPAFFNYLLLSPLHHSFFLRGKHLDHFSIYLSATPLRLLSFCPLIAFSGIDHFLHPTRRVLRLPLCYCHLLFIQVQPAATMISTLGGLFNLNHFDQSSRANDVIVIRHKDGSLHSTPFNVRFGRAQMWNYAGRVVQVEVNGELTTAVMKIGKGGETYWLQPTYGAFGGHAAAQDGADKTPAAAAAAATPSVAGDKQHAATTNVTPGAAAALVGTANISAAANTADKSSQERTAKESLSTSDENPSLAVNAADLQHFSIHPESPLEGPREASPPRQPSRAAVASAPPPQLSTPAAAAAAAKASPDATSPLTVEEAAASPQKRSPPQPPPPQRSATSTPPAASSESTSPLPLLHRGDDGHLMIETRAIHSAEDVQEARLALQAMAAAEKSRRRLSKLLLKDNPFFMQSAEEEGQLGSTTSSVMDEDDREFGEVGDGAKQTAGGEAAQAPLPPPPPLPATSAAPSHDKAPGGTVDGEAAAPAAPTRPAVPRAAAAAAPSARADAAEVSSVGSASSGSTDSYKVEEDDDYFLDPIDADEYAALYGQEELLKNVSFASSVTSGVSITDVAMGGSGSDVSKPSLPAARHTAAAATGECVVPAVSSSSAGDVGAPLRPAKATEKGSAASTTATTTTTNVGAAAAGSAESGAGGAGVNAQDAKKAAAAKRDAARDDMAEVLDAEGRVVQPSAAAAAGGPYFTRTLIPVEADLWKLHLVDGCNKVRYLARKDKGELVSISCNIFLWNWTDRLVVSDVDGTITKSDLLGHFYAMLGKGGDWTHPGICNLYSKIERNGYHMVYLTARSVSQINQTKSYLFTLQQEGVGLPLGPVLTAPQRFFTALTQEVSKQSHVFKIACLTSVRAAFPAHIKPFFAGFGNRYNDVISYDAVSIPTHKIFIIDPSSVLHVCLVKQTYRDLGHLVDVTFPPLKRSAVVLRAPRHQKHTHDQHAAKHHDRAKPVAAEARKSSTERHAYARDLLHRSSSASSSSMSSSHSDALSVSSSADQPEAGSVTSECSVGELSALSTSGVGQQRTEGEGAAPHRSNHQHQHSETGETMPMRHASAAFSLADSICVPPGGEAGVPAAATAAVNTATPGYGGAAGAGAACVPPATSTSAGATRAGAAAASSGSGSTEYSCFSGPASPFMVKASKAQAEQRVREGVASTVLFPSTAPVNSTGVSTAAAPGGLTSGTALQRPPPLPGALTRSGSTSANTSYTAGPAAAGRAAAVQTSAMATAPLTAAAAPASGPKYNYGQRGARGAVGGAAAVVVVDEEEEEVPVDSDFASFAYWRMDPRDLIAPPPAKAAASGERKMSSPQVAVAAAAASTAGGTKTAEGSRQASQPPPSFNEKTNASTELSSPETIKGRGIVSPNSPEDAVAAVKAAVVNTGGTVDAHKAGAEAAKASPTSASAYTDLATGAETDASTLRAKVAGAKEEGRATASSPTAVAAGRPEEASVAAEGKSNPASSAPEGGGPGQKSGSTRRGFLSALGFGRSAANAAAPESPNTQKARQLQAEAKQKALAHPDALEYYRLQQGVTQPRVPVSGAGGDGKGSLPSIK